MRIEKSLNKFIVLGILVALVTMSCGVFNTAQEIVENVPVKTEAPRPRATIAVPVPTMEPIKLPEAITNEEAVLTALYQQINPSVVNILTYASEGNVVAPTSQGSGFVFDSIGHIVTNSHVVHGSDAVDVSFSDGTVKSADIVGEDLHSDLAVLMVDMLPEGVLPLPLADIRNVAVGQTVIAIGNPFGLGGTLTRGVVSALGRTIPALTQFSIPQAIQTDAPINPGNSGGPLLNLRGEVIGVNAQIETGDGSRANSGVGFAIPVSIVSRVVPVLIEKGEYEWSWMGVVGGTISQALIEEMNLPVDKGAYILEVVQGGPADRAGLKGAGREASVDGRQIQIGGDVIIAVDGQPITSFEDMLIYIALNANPGQEIVVTIVRDGETIEVPITLDQRPNEERQFLQP